MANLAVAKQFALQVILLGCVWPSIHVWFKLILVLLIFYDENLSNQKLTGDLKMRAMHRSHNNHEYEALKGLQARLF